VASPMPDEAPVTSATDPSIFMGLPFCETDISRFEFARGFSIPGAHRSLDGGRMLRAISVVNEANSAAAYVRWRTDGERHASYGGELHRTRSSALLRVAGFKANVHNYSRTAVALRTQHSRRASAARIAWHTLTRKGLAKLPPAKPQP